MKKKLTKKELQVWKRWAYEHYDWKISQNMIPSVSKERYADNLVKAGLKVYVDRDLGDLK